MQHLKAIAAPPIQESINGFVGASKSYINNVVGPLKAIFVSAYTEGLIERDSTLMAPRPQKPRGADAIGNTARPENDPNQRGKSVPGDSLLSGVRRCRAVGLKWGTTTSPALPQMRALTTIC